MASCKKANQLPNESGSINGIPALTLYGSASDQTDYVFILITPTTADQLLCYQGITYKYGVNPVNNDISILASSSSVIRATLDTTGAHTVLTILTYPSIFNSTEYIAR